MNGKGLKSSDLFEINWIFRMHDADEFDIYAFISVMISLFTNKSGSFENLYNDATVSDIVVVC